MNELAPAPAAPHCRRRKLRITLALLGFLFAALVAFVFVPGGGRSEAMRFRFHMIKTNEDGGVWAWFIISNTGPRSACLMSYRVQIHAEGQWSAGEEQNYGEFCLHPGESRGLSVRVPSEPGRWHVDWVWFEMPGRITAARVQLLVKAERVWSGGLKHAKEAMQALVQTNHSPEFHVAP